MPGFTLSGRAGAPVEEVWKLLFDPTRFPEWWAGVETVRDDGADGYTQWLQDYPDFPMPQELRGDRAHGRITISCLVSDIEFRWQLVPDGPGTRIDVHVAVPDAQAHRCDGQRTVMVASLARLVTLAEAAAATT